MQAGLPHRTGCHPLIIHLAPKASTDQLSLRSASQNRTKAARRQSTQRQCHCNVPLCPSREHVHNMASPRSSHHCSMSNHTSMRTTRFAGATTSCDVPSRTIRTSKAENTFTSCPSGLDRPSSELSMSSCWWPHHWWLNNLSSRGSRNPCCRAVADADEPSGRAINGFVTFTQRSTRAAAGDGPPTSRTRRFGR